MLETRALNLHYGASHILRDVDLKAERGQVTCVLGRNGVGKTSLMRAISGLHPTSGGSLSWAGTDLTRLPPHRRARAGIGYVPQDREIFPRLTVEENLRTGLAAANGQGKAGLDESVFELFPVLKDMLKRRGGDLSGGQQQQLAIARALTMRPGCLLLDEPTEGIQPSIIKDIAGVIAKLAESGEMAILLVEQYFDFARDLADEIYVMDRGQIVLSGAKRELEEADVRQHLTV
jgi:urea transport system ATP-binding protein